jgi:hypothetical protein
MFNFDFLYKDEISTRAKTTLNDKNKNDKDSVIDKGLRAE